jgi:hypothetical protein
LRRIVFGQARYRNRFVQTSGFVTEGHAGRAIYGSLTHPVPIDPNLIGVNRRRMLITNFYRRARQNNELRCRLASNKLAGLH